MRLGLAKRKVGLVERLTVEGLGKAPSRFVLTDAWGLLLKITTNGKRLALLG